VGDKIVFVIPDTLEEALWALPVISQHLGNRLVTGRAAEKVYCFCPIVDIRYLFTACWHGMEVLEFPMPEEIRNEVDVLFEFNPDKSYALTQAVGKHIVEAYGTMLGTVAMSILPPIASKEREEPGTVLVVKRHKLDREMVGSWWHSDEFVRMGKAFGIPVSLCNENLEFRELVTEVGRASVVVGIRGTGTLLASAFGKTVMELSPENWGTHKNWMSKWENKRYRMMYGDLKDMNAIFVWERTRVLVEEAAKKNAKQWERR